MRALVEKFSGGLQEDIPAGGELNDQRRDDEHSGEIELDPEIIAGKLSSMSVKEYDIWVADVISQRSLLGQR